MSRRFGRRELFLGAIRLSGLTTLSALPAAAAAAAGESPSAEPRVGDLAGAGDWAGRAHRALAQPGRVFLPCDGGAWCDLGVEGRLEATTEGRGAALVTLRGRWGELEILRSLDAPRVARVEARPADPFVATAGAFRYDTLRRVPGGFELTFASALALRHVAPRRVAAEPPVAYELLAAAAVDAARAFLS